MLGCVRVYGYYFWALWPTRNGKHCWLQWLLGRLRCRDLWPFAVCIWLVLLLQPLTFHSYFVTPTEFVKALTATIGLVLSSSHLPLNCRWKVGAIAMLMPTVRSQHHEVRWIYVLRYWIVVCRSSVNDLVQSGTERLKFYLCQCWFCMCDHV